MRIRLWVFVVAFVGVSFAGCTSDAKSTQSLSAERKAALEELGTALKSLVEEGRKPPDRLAALESIEPMLPSAGPAIRSGDIVYFWGAGFVSGGKQIVAYDKAAESERGWVLLQDGNVKEMSADEFRNAPKAKK